MAIAASITGTPLGAITGTIANADDGTITGTIGFVATGTIGSTVSVPGATGPAGPAGPTGATGATGPAGADGQDGAEVTISDTAPVSPDAGALWLRTTDYRQFTWTGTEWVEFSSGFVDEMAESFETVSKNLRAYPAAFAYSGGDLASITYSLGAGLTIVKTFNRTAGNLTSVVISGSVPSGIATTKTLTYSAGELVGITYS